MKFTKISLLIIGVGVLIAVFVILYLSYSQNVNQREALFQTIEAAQNQISKISAQKRPLEPQVAQLEQKIADLKSSYDKAKGEFPVPPTQSIEYDNELSDLAEDCAITVTKLTATDSTVLKEGSTTYIATDFTVEVKGDRTNLLDFIHRVSQSKYFSTASINSLNLKEEAIPTPTPTEETAPAPLNYSTLSMALTVYRYEGN